jgi:hypothetical protein
MPRHLQSAQSEFEVVQKRSEKARLTLSSNRDESSSSLAQNTYWRKQLYHSGITITRNTFSSPR